MGTYLTKPNLCNEGEHDSNEFLTYAAASMQGWRISQEDEFACINEFKENNMARLFAIFDGHGGSEVAKYCAVHLYEILEKNQHFLGDKPKMIEALKTAFIECDELIAKPETKKELAEYAKQDEEIESSSEEEELDEKTVEDLKKEAEQPLEQVVENISEQLADETKTLLEARRNSCLPGQGGSSTSNCPEDKPKEEAKEVSKAEIKDAETLDNEGEEEESTDEDYEDGEDDDEEIDLDEISRRVSSKFEDESDPGFTSGCTVCAGLLVPDLTTQSIRLFLANVGDSRAVLSRAGKAVDLSCDHKPENEIESSRIKAAGGTISEDGRVNKGLNMSRAIGDHTYKKREDLKLADQMITAMPDVTDTKLNPDTDDFLVIACDGIWNVMNSQEVVDFISARLKDPSLIGTQRKKNADFCVEESDDDEEEQESKSDQEKETEAEANGDEEKDSKSIEENSSDEEEDSDDEEDNREIMRDGSGRIYEICIDLFHECLAPSTAGDGTGCDNMTCIIVKFEDLKELAKLAKVQCGEVCDVKLPSNELLPEGRKRFAHDDSSEEESEEKEADSQGDDEPEDDNNKAKKPKLETVESEFPNGVNEVVNGKH